MSKRHLKRRRIFRAGKELSLLTRRIFFEEMYVRLRVEGARLMKEFSTRASISSIFFFEINLRVISNARAIA